MSDPLLQTWDLIIVERDEIKSRFFIDQVRPERITMNPEGRPDINNAIVKVDGQWKVQMAEDIDYKISFEVNPFNMTDFPPRPLKMTDAIVIGLDGDDIVTIFGNVDGIETGSIKLDVEYVDFSFTVIEDFGIKDGDEITLKLIGGEWTIDGHSDRKYWFDLQDYPHRKLDSFPQNYIYQIFVVGADWEENKLDMMMNSARSYQTIEGVLDYVRTFLSNMVKGETEDDEAAENPILFTFFDDLIGKQSLDTDNIGEFLPKFIRDLSINMATESRTIQIFRTPFDSGARTKSSGKRS